LHVYTEPLDQASGMPYNVDNQTFSDITRFHSLDRLTDCTFKDIVQFRDCNSITIENCTFNYSTEFSNCKLVIIKNCTTKNITFESSNSEVSDCKYIERYRNSNSEVNNSFIDTTVLCYGGSSLELLDCDISNEIECEGNSNINIKSS
jgi:hypothetical protein